MKHLCLGNIMHAQLLLTYCFRLDEQSLMYILNYIDRNALPQAKVQGISEDIGLAGIEYNIVLSLTFIGYILMQGQHNIKVVGSSYFSADAY